MPPDARNPRRGSMKLSSSNPSTFLDSTQRFFARSYAGDYLGLALIVVLYIPLKLFNEPFHQMFRLNDPRIQHPHAGVERVGLVMLLVYTVPIPVALLTIWTSVLRPSKAKAHAALLGLAISMCLTTLLTDIFKDAVGRPRPDLLARCQPAPGTPRDELVTVDVCTESSHHMLHDGWRSFPSGHSSLAFSSLSWVALFLASQTHALRPRASLAVVLLCLAPLVGAAMIAVSRLEDYRHDVEDVIVGSLLGFGMAYLNWRRYWPGLMDRRCDEPYGLAESGKSSPNGGFRRVRDEEEEDVEREPFEIGDEDER